MKAGFWQNKRNIYFIGIGGISMSGLAMHLVSCGFSVSGSDRSESEITANLRRAGLEVTTSLSPERACGADVVVYTSAIAETHEELSAAREAGVETIERADLLHLVASDYEHVVGVAGCHGKTTATAMCAHVLDACSGSCSAHIGGLDMTYGNFHEGGTKYFVTEACEYKASYLRLHPEMALFLNSGADHLECYGSREALDRAVDSLARYMRTKSFEYNQEHPNNEVIIKDIKQMSEGGIEIDEVALNNLRSDYKQHLPARQQKGQQQRQQKASAKSPMQKGSFTAQKNRQGQGPQKNNREGVQRYNSQK